jgi:DNA-directed RNA polymerase
LNTIWLSPGGLIIEQRYVEKNKIDLTTTILGKRKSITIQKPIKEKINLRKQNEAIVPNIVHSFDASNISLLIKELIKNNNNINILTIHNCFATHANNVELMRYHVKLAFLLLYFNNNFINYYHNFIIDYVKKSGFIIESNYVWISTKKKIEIPSIPDLKYNKDFEENILGSQYFIN